MDISYKIPKEAHVLRTYQWYLRNINNNDMRAFRSQPSHDRLADTTATTCHHSHLQTVRVTGNTR